MRKNSTSNYDSIQLADDDLTSEDEDEEGLKPVDVDLSKYDGAPLRLRPPCPLAFKQPR
jgi:hypothetical protein